MSETTANMGSEYGFHVADYVIFAGMISFSIGIGIYPAFYGGRQKTTQEYLVGNRRLSMLPVAFSLVVSFESSILVLGYPADVYIYGVMLIWSSVGLMVTMLVSTRIVVPLMHPLKLTSVYEYFELRYRSTAPRMLGTVIGMLYTIFYMGIVLYGPAIAIEAVTDFPFWASVISVAAAAMLYTAIVRFSYEKVLFLIFHFIFPGAIFFGVVRNDWGGLKAVVWTDNLQCIIMILGMVAVIIKGSIDVGGIETVWKINYENLRLNFLDLNPDPTVRHTFWPLSIGTVISYFGIAFNQASVQRISSVKTQKEANNIFLISGPVFMVISQIVILEGLVMFAYFNVVGCDPLVSGQISSANQVLPLMVVRIFKNQPGLSGLFLASLFSASLSTISSGLSSLSAQTVEDFIKPRYKTMSDRRATRIAKFSVVFFGGISLGITAMIANIPGSLIQVSYSILTCFGGPLSGMFLFSAFCPWASRKGVVIGTVLSMCFVFWMSVGMNFFSTHPKQPWLPPNPTDSCILPSNTTSNSTMYVYNETQSMRISAYNKEMDIFNSIQAQGIDKLYTVSYRWFGTIGVILSIVLGSIFSYMTGRPPIEDVDFRYILPLGDQLFPYLPKNARRFLEFGVDFKKRALWLETLTKNLADQSEPCIRVSAELDEYPTKDTTHRTDMGIYYEATAEDDVCDGSDGVESHGDADNKVNDEAKGDNTPIVHDEKEKTGDDIQFDVERDDDDRGTVSAVITNRDTTENLGDEMLRYN